MEWESFERQLKIETTSKCFEHSKSAAAVAELSPDGASFTLIYATEAMAKFFGISREELTSKEFFELFPEYNHRWCELVTKAAGDVSGTEYARKMYLTKTESILGVRAFYACEGCCILLASDISRLIGENMDNIQTISLFRTDRSADIIAFVADESLALVTCGARGVELLCGSEGGAVAEGSSLADYMTPDDADAARRAVADLKDGDRIRIKFHPKSDPAQLRQVEGDVKIAGEENTLVCGGVLRDITEVIAREDMLCELPFLLQTVGREVACAFFLNLTQDTCECRFSKDDTIKSLADKGTAEAFFSRAYNRLDDYKNLIDYQQRFGRKRMTALYENGTVSASLEHRMVINDEHRWLRTESAVYKNDDGDICAWVFIRDIDTDKNMRTVGYAACRRSALLIDSRSGAVRELPRPTGGQKTYASWVNARLCGKIAEREQQTFAAIALDTVRKKLEKNDLYEVEIKAGGVIGHEIWSFSPAHELRDTIVLTREKARYSDDGTAAKKENALLKEQISAAQEMSAAGARNAAALEARLSNANDSIASANAEIERLFTAAKRSEEHFNADMAEQKRLYKILGDELGDERSVKNERAERIIRLEAGLECANDKITEQSGSIARLESELAEERRRGKNLAAELERTSADNTRNSQLATRLIKELSDSRDETALERKNAEQRESELMTALDAEKELGKNTAMQLGDKTRENERNIANGERLTAELKEAKAEIADLESQLAGEKKRTKSLTTELDSERRENTRNGAEAARLADALEKARSEANQTEATLRAKLGEERKQVKELTAEVRAEHRAKEALSDSAAKLTVDLESSRNKTYQYKQSSQKFEADLAEERKQTKQLGETLDSERRSSDKTIDTLKYQLNTALEKLATLERSSADRLDEAQRENERLRGELAKQLATPAQTLARAEYTGDMRAAHDASRSRLGDIKNRLALAAAGEYAPKRTDTAAAAPPEPDDEAAASTAESRSRRRLRARGYSGYLNRRNRPINDEPDTEPASASQGDAEQGADEDK